LRKIQEGWAIKVFSYYVVLFRYLDFLMISPSKITALGVFYRVFKDITSEA
jgi:hypothetical protein